MNIAMASYSKKMAMTRKDTDPRIISLFKADAAANIGPGPAPANISAELISGGNTEKFITTIPSAGHTHRASRRCLAPTAAKPTKKPTHVPTDFARAKSWNQFAKWVGELPAEPFALGR